ncbi:FHA domain-containing protein [Nostoc sp. UHCC 0302]
MSTYKCPKGHDSTESDFCSDCGSKILGVTEQALDTNTIPSKLTQSIGVETCPACSAPHEADSGVFCEICGYNFVTGVHGEVPIAKEAGEQEGRGAGEAGGEITFSSPVAEWELIVTVDPSLRESESPEAPINQAPLTFRLEKDSNLIGRSSEIRGIHPEVPLDFDDAVSRRHALLNRQPDGSFTLRDIDSANGTKLNGVELQPMVDAPLQDKDEFTLGHWTRIIVKAVRQS